MKKKSSKKETKQKKETKKETKKEKKKKEEETEELNEKLMDRFSEELEGAINKVCEEFSGTDPRMELLISLGLFTSQVAYEVGFSKGDLLEMIGDFFQDFDENDEEVKEEVPLDKSKLN